MTKATNRSLFGSKGRRVQWFQREESSPTVSGGHQCRQIWKVRQEAESSHPQQQKPKEASELSKPPPGRIPFSKARPPKVPQIAPSAFNQLFKYPSLWGTLQPTLQSLTPQSHGHTIIQTHLVQLKKFHSLSVLKLLKSPESLLRLRAISDHGHSGGYYTRSLLFF